jgi:hypothetical protein
VKRTGLFLTFALLLPLAPTAIAAKPVKEPLPAPEPSVFPAGEICPFPLLVETVTNREKSITFSDGSQLITGAFKDRLTNLATGESILVNASGPARLTFDGDILHVVSRGASLLLANATQPGGPGALFVHGFARYDIDLLTGEPLFLVVRGTTRDLCEQLI